MGDSLQRLKKIFTKTVQPIVQPTYGTCHRCYGSGPAGQMCKTCNRPDCQFRVVFGRAALSCKAIIDSQWLSGLLGAGHENAKADLEQAWKITPTMYMDPDFVVAQIGEKHKGQGSKQYELELIEADKARFVEGLFRDYEKEDEFGYPRTAEWLENEQKRKLESQLTYAKLLKKGKMN
jgi:hypothetical protein